LVDVVLFGAFQFLDHVLGHNGQRNQLPMPVLKRGASQRPVVLEDEDVLEAPVLFQIDNAVAKRPQNVFDSLLRKGRQGGIVLRPLDDDLVRADAVHLVEHAFGLTVQASLDPQRRKLVRYNAYAPALAVARGPVWAVGQNLRRRLVLIAGTERAEATLHLHRFTAEVGGTLGAVGRNNDPPPDDRIFAQLGHGQPRSDNLLSYATDADCGQGTKAQTKAAWASLYSTISVMHGSVIRWLPLGGAVPGPPG